MLQFPDQPTGTQAHAIYIRLASIYLKEENVKQKPLYYVILKVFSLDILYVIFRINAKVRGLEEAVPLSMQK